MAILQQIMSFLRYFQNDMIISLETLFSKLQIAPLIILLMSLVLFLLCFLTCHRFVLRTAAQLATLLCLLTLLQHLRFVL